MKCAAGIKPLLVEKNCSFISLLVNCFLIGCCVVPPLSLKREIGWRNGTEGKKIKIDKACVCSVRVCVCERERGKKRPTEEDKVCET